MFCQRCGNAMADGARFCGACGSAVQNGHPGPSLPQGAGVGFSLRIQDPAFARYKKNASRWSMIFAFILFVGFTIGFYLYGENSNEMENPQALYIGLGLGTLFVVIALVQTARRVNDKTWDGTVVDKKAERKSRRVEDDDDQYRTVHYMLYTVVIRQDSGKMRQVSIKDNDHFYQYYQVWDRIRYHGGLRTYEKYDKSRDSILYCNACGTEHDVREDFCRRCKCPLLK